MSAIIDIAPVKFSQWHNTKRTVLVHISMVADEKYSLDAVTDVRRFSLEVSTQDGNQGFLFNTLASTFNLLGMPCACYLKSGILVRDPRSSYLLYV